MLLPTRRIWDRGFFGANTIGATRKGERFPSATTRGEPGTEASLVLILRGNQEGGKVLQCYYQGETWDRGFFSADTGGSQGGGNGSRVLLPC